MAYPSVLQYELINSESYAKACCDQDGCVENNPVYNWMLYGKLPETIYITPGYDAQHFSASAKNRYISDVYVQAITPFTATTNITAATSDTYTISGANSVASTIPANATAVLNNGVITITGVTAGPTIVTVYDSNNDLMATINVTVVAA